MGEILALGISHYPPLAGDDARMGWILKRMLENPDLPAAMRTPDGWPEAMRAEWGDDEGRSAAARHRHQMVGQLRRAREALDAFKPDVVLIWGDDQYENFREDIIPPYCVLAHERFEFHPPQNNVWDEASDSFVSVKGHVPAAKHLASELINAGFDAAYSYKPLHHPLGHAFGNAILYLDYDRKGFDYPVIPFSVNCYGRSVICQRGGLPKFDKKAKPVDFDPPAPQPWRLFDMGAAAARILTASPWRVAIVASSGWSHAFLTEKTRYLHPDIEADQALYDALRDGDYQAWRAYPAAAIEASGQQEVLNWMCLAGALSELQRRPAEMDLLKTWVFNSSKCLLIAPPASTGSDRQQAES